MAYTLLPTDLWDNVENSNQGAYYYTSDNCRTIWITDATSVNVASYSTMYGVGGGIPYATVSIRVDGADYATKTCTAVSSTLNFTLPAGTKTVEVVAGIQGYSGAQPYGTFLVSVDWLGGTVATIQAPTVAANRIVLDGDSIAVGEAASVPELQGWTALVKNSRGNGSLVNLGYASKALVHVANGTTLTNATVAKLVALAAPYYYLALGTNDFGAGGGFGQWSAANFGTAYGNVLTGLHAGLPNAIVYCQTPLVRSNEAANGYSNTLGDYRAAIATAVAARSSYAKLIDGAAILTVADLNATDGLHPTTAGHAKYAAYVLGVLGSRAAFHACNRRRRSA
jgi:lysophospholipase L1-like esterase